LPGDFVPRFELYRAVLAVALIFSAGLFLREIRALPGKGLATWTVGLALVWSELMTLWTPWLDYMKSYRPVFSAMPLAKATDCIASLNLGEGERAMLHYVTGRDTVRREVAPHAPCTFLLVQRAVGAGPAIDNTRWQVVWQGERPAPAKERFWLFRAMPPDRYVRR
jgi:4-amino-4-deoxy-L-arabinose transferase-like glycosyltransferase